MKNIKFMCAPGYPMPGGTVAYRSDDARLLKASTVDGPYLVKASIVDGVHLAQPAQRERVTAAAVVTTVRVQTAIADLLPVSSALTRERRT